MWPLEVVGAGLGLMVEYRTDVREKKRGQTLRDEGRAIKNQLQSPSYSHCSHPGRRAPLFHRQRRYLNSAEADAREYFRRSQRGDFTSIKHTEVLLSSIVPSRKICSIPNPQVPGNVALFGNKDFADRAVMRSYWIKVGPHPMTGWQKRDI